MKKDFNSSSSSVKQNAKSRATVYMVNGDRYLGEWKGNVKQGKGLYFSKKSGSIYQGEWKDDKRHGFGTLSIRLKTVKPPAMTQGKDTGKSEGAVDELSKIFSQMTEDHHVANPNAIYAQGNLRKVYAGHWANNLREGYGTSFENDGSTYEGDWKQNHKSGWGVMYFNDGSRYEGEWYLSKRHGQGMFIHVNGNRYEGMWFNDLKEGPGKFIYKDQRRCYQGEWSMDQPKCGTMVDMPVGRPKAFQEPFVQKHPIPELKLKNPDAIIMEQKSTIQQERIKRLWPVPMQVTEALEEAHGTSNEEDRVASPVSEATGSELDDEDEERIEELYPYLVEGSRTVDSHFLHEKMQDFHRLETV